MTISNIIMLNASSFSPKSTCRPPMVSQSVMDSPGVGCQPLALMKTRVRMKPVTIAPMDNSALTVRCRNVNSVMPPAASSGRNRISQGKISYFIQLSR